MENFRFMAQKIDANKFAMVVNKTSKIIIGPTKVGAGPHTLIKQDPKD